MTLPLTLLIVVTYNCSCSSADNNIFSNKDIYLHSSVLQVPKELQVRYPFRLALNDSSVYITDLHADEYFCHKVELMDNKRTQPLMKRGSGPCEYTDAENIRLDKQGNIYILDANLRRIAVWNADNDTLSSIPLAGELIRTLDFDLVTDSTLVVPDYTGKYRYTIINRKGKILNSYGKIPLRNNNDTRTIATAQAWRAFIDYNPDSGILAMATQLGHVLELYNLKTNQTIKIIYGAMGEPEFNTNKGYVVPNGIMGYGDVQVTKKKIYALFWGRSFKDIRNNPNITEGGNTIEVYDLNGNALYRYQLDKYITGFKVDENKKQIIALDINSDKTLIQFPIP